VVVDKEDKNTFSWEKRDYKRRRSWFP